MFDFPSFRVGRLFGIPVEVNASWLVIFALVSFSLTTSYFPAIGQARGASPALLVVVGVVTSLLFFLSVLAHELCHSLVVKAEGGHVDRITLFIFGGVAQMDEEPRSPGREFLMAAAGPAMSLLISAVCFGGFALAVANSAPWWVWAPLEYLTVINLAVGIFNLLPGFPLDGGRVLRSILWAITGDILKATRWASRSGQVIGWAMMASAVLGVLNGRTDLIWFGLIGWFIASLAGQAYRQQVLHSRIEGVTAEEIMTATPAYIDGDATLDQAVHDHFLSGQHTRYPVMYEGAIIGLATLQGIKRVDKADWPFVRVVDVTDRNLDELVVDRLALVDTLIARLAGDRPGALLVVGDGRLVGVITRADVLALLQERADA